MIAPGPAIGETEVAEHYDRLNGFYRDVWGLHRHHGLWVSGREAPCEAIELMARRILKGANITGGGRVVDVGCGTGGIAWDFAEKKGAEVLGYTLSEEERKTAGEHEPGALPGAVTKPEFVCSDWLDNDVPDEWADAVVIIESLSHMVDRRKVFLEVARVLKPGGRVVLTDWLASPAPRKWELEYLLQPVCRGGSLTGLSHLEEVRQLLDECLLRPVEISDITSSVTKTWRVIAGLLMGKVVTSPLYRSFLWRCLLRDRALLFAIPRVMAAYRVGCLRYGWFVAEKASCQEA